MRAEIAKLPLILGLCLAFPVWAQDGKVIDVFDGQSEMKTTSISVETTDGAPIIDSGDDDSGPADLGGGFVLNFEKNGSSILVPAQVNGQAAYFIFDTGATITTLPSAFAKSAGAGADSDAPRMRFQTANGPTSSRIGMIRNLMLGGRSHSGVTYSECNSCPAGRYKGKPIVGLLGMNVIGRYRTSFDHSRGVIEMSPSSGYSDRSSDIRPWLRFKPSKLARNAKGWEMPVVNRSPRRISQMTLKYSCSGGTPRESTKSVAAGGTVNFFVRPKDGNCRKGFDQKLVNARW
jgi:hypothetical protein